MKTIGIILLAASINFSPSLLHTQTPLVGSFNNDLAPVQSATPDSIVQVTAEARGLATISYDNLPRSGTFWEAMPDGIMAPLPCPPQDITLPIYTIKNDIFLVDATGGEVAAQPHRFGMQVQTTASSVNAALESLATSVVNLIDMVMNPPAQKMPSLMMQTSMMMASSLSTSYAYNNSIRLANMTRSYDGYGNFIFGFTVLGGTNFVPWDIEMSTNLTAPNWTWQGIAYTSNSYAFYGQPSGIAFYRLVKPTKTMTVGIGNDVVGQCDVPYGLTNAVQVAGGGGQSIALKADGTAVGWGQNYYGQAAVPTNLTGIAMVAAGWYHSLAMLTNGTVVAWGISSSPLFGGLHVTNVPANLTNAVVISAQALHTLALRSDGTVVAWGYNTSFGETNVPAGLTNVTAISAGYQFNLVVSNSYVVAWGDNTAGQCNVPANLSNVVDVAAGTFHSLAMLQNGTVVAWGDNFYGESTIPAGLTNVVAIAAGGDPEADTAYSMALKNDGTVVIWGDDDAVDPVGGLNAVVGIAAGADHALAIRTGPPAPVITLEPSDEYQVQGKNATFTARGAGLYGVTYQWQTNGISISDATNGALSLTNVQPGMAVPYSVVVTDNGYMGSLVSSNANLYLVTTPDVNSQSLPTNQVVLFQASLTLNVSASALGITNGFPLSYQWQFNGTNIAGQTSSNYTFNAVSSGTYTLIVSNAAGTTSVSWQVTVLYPGGVIPWGSNSNGQLNVSSQLTNVISLAAGKAHGIVALDTGVVTNWGSYWTETSFVSVSVPPLLTNALAVAAGSRHDLALKTDGTVVSWGVNDFGQTNVPANATNVIAIAAGGQQSLALLKTGTVMQWGQTNGAVPSGLTNVTAIAAGTNFSLALLQNSTVIAWGANNYGQTNIPAGLSNVVAIAAGGAHALALEQNGTVVAWGVWTNVPANLTNAMNVAAGENHSLALKNDGTVIAWSDDTFEQTNIIVGLNQAKLIAGGGDFSLAVQFSPTVMYPVNVTKDLLLIYNTNSQDSATVLNYYLAHRPMVGGANVLGLGCSNLETVLPSYFTNIIIPQVQGWLNTNPTKRPQYVVLFYDVPSRVNTNNVEGDPNNPQWPSVQYQISTNCSVCWNPFVTSINFNGTNDCIAYIKKLEYFGTNYSPGKLAISAAKGGYANTNYVIDDVHNIYCGNTTASVATNGLLAAGVPSADILYLNGCESSGNLPHLTNVVNVAGYITWGSHSSLSGNYPYDEEIGWHGNSGWWIIETIESFNGQRLAFGQGNFVKWFTGNSFGGTNYQNTPVGGVSHTDEPGLGGVSDSAKYFGLWASGKNLAICAWNSKITHNFQALGDPFVTK
jgi:alpha-tubulin suppressor-like RCC1 family protein